MKKSASFLIIFSMIISLLGSVESSANSHIEIGDYLQMGTYSDEPILWRCVDIDENGPLMLSDKVLCWKMFDSSGKDKSGSNSRHALRCTIGSNYWGDSNIRDWLNSIAKDGEVYYSDGNPPKSYLDEAGFLYGFSEMEIDSIKEVTQKNILSNYDKILDDSGAKKSHKIACEIEEVVQNYDESYSEQITDKVFLLDVKQLNATYRNLGDYYIGHPTEKMSLEHNWSNVLNVNYALRTPSTSHYDMIRVVQKNGSITSGYGYGIRPAFYLNENIYFENGDGTENNPYIVDEENYTNAEYNEEYIDGVVAENFNIKEDGWSFDNSWLSFGLESTKENYIDYSVWEDVYGQSIRPIVYDGMTAKKIGGYCYGMNAYATLLYNGVYSLPGEYETVYDAYINNGGQKVCPIELIPTIQRVQISQYSKEHKENEGKITDIINEFDEIKQNIDNGCVYLVNTFYYEKENGRKKKSGHSMVSCGYRELGNNKYRISLYDPNKPYPVEGWDSRHLDIDLNDGTWKLECSTNSNSSNTVVKSTDEGAQLYFEDPMWHSEFEDFAGYTFDIENDMLFNGKDLTIYDRYNRQILKIKNNSIISKSDDVEVYSDIAGENAYENLRICLNYTDVSNIVIDDSTIIMMNSDTVSKVYSNASAKISIENNNIYVEANENSEVSVLSENIIDRDIYEAVNVSGNLKSNENILLSNYGENQFATKSNAESAFDVTLYSDDEIQELSKIDLSNFNTFWDNDYNTEYAGDNAYYKNNIDDRIIVALNYYDENNSEEIQFDQQPIIQNDRTLVPMRAIFEAMGCDVYWDDDLQQVDVYKDGDNIMTLWIDDTEMWTENGYITLDVPPQILNDRTLVPVRAISESMGAKVDWDGELKLVDIHYYPPYSGTTTSEYYYKNQSDIVNFGSILNDNPYWAGEDEYCCYYYSYDENSDIDYCIEQYLEAMENEGFDVEFIENEGGSDFYQITGYGYEIWFINDYLLEHIQIEIK